MSSISIASGVNVVYLMYVEKHWDMSILIKLMNVISGREYARHPRNDIIDCHICTLKLYI